MRNFICCLLFVSLFFACSQSPYRAKVEYEGYNPITQQSTNADINDTSAPDTSAPVNANEETVVPIIEQTNIIIEQNVESTPTQVQGTYVVQEGDTAYSIARKHHMPLAELRSKNNLDANYTIHSGEVLVVSTTNTKPTSKATKPATTQSKSRDWPSPLAQPIIVADYLQAKNKSDRNGMLLTAKPNSAVMAVADGVVVFAGNDLRPYDNMVLIDHGDRVISTYAYLGTISVTEDAKVRRGQTIGRLARTDMQPMLLQIRYAGKSINPRKYIFFPK